MFSLRRLDTVLSSSRWWWHAVDLLPEVLDAVVAYPPGIVLIQLGMGPWVRFREVRITRYGA